MPRPLYLQRKSPLDIRLGDYRAGLEDVEKGKFFTLPGLEL
jgi:hypothetical protein